MNINFQNVHLSKNFYIHDSIFLGYHYDYDKRTIQLTLLNELNNIVQRIVLNNVILSQIQSCSFWGDGNAIYYLRCYAEHPFFDQLNHIKTDNIRNIDGSRLDMGITYIVFELQVNSGDSMCVVCESVDYEEETVHR